MPVTEHDHDLFDDEPLDIEAYCVRCRVTVLVENPEPVWTRKGVAATRGFCPNCGGVVFRMGKTPLHDKTTRPEPITIGSEKRKPPKLEPTTVYINYAPSDEEMAGQIAADLEKVGVATWLHESEPEDVNWAGGVHPALKACARMVYLLSPTALEDAGTAQALEFFREKRKPVVIAQIAPAEPPDRIRRSPRFDFAADYRAAFRAMLGELSR